MVKGISYTNDNESKKVPYESLTAEVPEPQQIPVPKQITSPRKIKNWQRDMHALALRIAGLTYEEIAEIQECVPGTAYDRVKRALAKSRRYATEELRDKTLARLEALLRSIWDRATHPESPDLAALDRVLSIIDREARLEGLNEPARAKAEITVRKIGPEDFTDEELAEIIGETDEGTCREGTPEAEESTNAVN